MPLSARLWIVGVDPEREPTQTWEDHANSTQNGLGHMVDLKLLAVRGVRRLHWPVCGPDLFPTENM